MSTPQEPRDPLTDPIEPSDRPPPTVPNPRASPADDDTTQGADGLVTSESLRLAFSAVSDVGRVRKDNQDSGYGGAWLLAVCDGVGGGARGDVASSTAVAQLRRLDERPGPDLLGLLAGGLVRAHDRIAELVDDDPALNGTSTTATVALFDGTRVGIAHVGDSRAYLMRSGTLTQLTRDHTFVQSLIDEGRITEEESRTHPHRNLILKALDGVRDPEPDLFVVDLAVGDRLLLCSDGACGFLSDDEMLAVLADGSPDTAALELVQAALEARSTDNVTCVVADVVPVDVPPDPDSAAVDESGALVPMLVGAAAELPRRSSGRPVTAMFRHRGEADPDEQDPAARELPPEAPHAIPTDPIDPERARYAPRPPRRYLLVRRLLLGAVVVGLLWVGTSAAYSWTQRQYYVAEDDGMVTVFRGVNAEVPGLSLSSPYEETDVAIESLPSTDAEAVRAGIEATDLDDALETVDELAARTSEEPSDPLSDPEPNDEPSGGATGGTNDPSGGPSADPSGSTSDVPDPTTEAPQPDATGGGR